MRLFQTGSAISSLLSAICISLIAEASYAQNQEDASQYVLADTAYTDVAEYIENRAESIIISGHSFIGPGPFTITFHAELSKQPSYCCWELAEDNRFENVIDQFRTLDNSGEVSEFDYEFSEAGSYFVRFVADFTADSSEGNATSISYSTSEPYQIQITESLLEIPNLITPDSPESKNSTFRVRYKSLVSYEIWIHNRWGQELFHSTNPEEGWDGRSGGSTVPTGAYFYLIKAEGTEGLKYNKKGSINVLRTKDKSSNSKH